MKKLLLIALIVSMDQPAAQPPKLIPPVGHTQPVRAVDFSPDGKRVVSAAEDNIAIIWDTETGMQLANLEGHTKLVSIAAYSPDGNRIMTVAADLLLNIWDAKTGNLLRTITTGHHQFIPSACFSPDGRLIVTGSLDSTIKIWDAEKGNLVREISGSGTAIRSVCFSPDGKKILSAGGFKAFTWDTGAGSILTELKGHVQEVYGAAFSGDGKKILSWSLDYTAKIWDAETGALLTDLKGHRKRVTAAVFNEDGTKVATSSLDSSAGIWDAVTGRRLVEVKEKKAPLWNIRFSPDGKTFMTKSDEPEVITRDTETGKLIHILAGHTDYVAAFEYNRDGTKIVTGGHDNAVKVWEAATGKPVSDLSSRLTEVKKAFYSPDRKYILTYTGYDTYILWDAQTGQRLYSPLHPGRKLYASGFSPDGKKIAAVFWDSTCFIIETATGRFLQQLKGHTDFINSAVFSPDGKKIITASEDKTAILWDAVTGRSLLVLKGKPAPLNHASFSPDGKKIVTVSDGEPAVIRDALTGKQLAELDADEIGSSVYQALFSPDGKKLATASTITASIWDPETGKQLFLLRGHIRSVNEIAFSPDGKKLLTASSDGTARVWETATGKLLFILKGHEEDVRGASFDPDGKSILTWSNDRTARIWDADNGRLLFNLKGHLNDLTSGCFSPDGKYVITSSWDNSARVWDTKKGMAVCSFYPVGINDYFLQIPSGYYRTTTAAAKLLHYVTQDLRVITFEQLDVKYNRPDKVLEAIGCTDTLLIRSYRKAWEKRIKKLGVDTTAFRDGYSVPEADFVNRDAIEFEQKSGLLRVRVRGQDSTYKLDRFNIWVNESPLFGQRGITLRRQNSHRLDTILSIPLSQGENRIETSITNVNGTESYRMPLMVNYQPAVKEPEMTRFIGIGIDQFADKQYNLQYSAKDIRDMAMKLKEKYGEGMIIDTLFNRQVTVGNVKALKQKLLQSGVNDKVILAYSGHGLLSRDFDYYLSTYAVNFQAPELNGLPYEELEALLDSIPARKKLLLIDACHSGEVDKEELVRIEKTSGDMKLAKGIKPVAYADGTQHLGMKNSFELMQSLFVNVGKSTGATVISAAAGTQFALERGDLRNGVFTYSILEAMDKYATMKISELKKIVGERVEQLTNGLQKPTSRNENISVDWSLW